MENKYQKQYWSLLITVKTEAFYFANYAIITEKWNRSIDMGLAIASSLSIAGWVIWNEFAWVWGIIIMSSQVIVAIKHLMPYKIRLKLLNDLYIITAKISLAIEKEWFSIAEGKLTDEEIHNLISYFKNKLFEDREKTRKSKILEKKPKIMDASVIEAEKELKNNYL